MPLFATVADLIKGCPRNIKRRLLRDILLILFITTGAIILIVLFQGVKTQKELSSSLITEANRSVRNHFYNFIEPLDNTMRLLVKWGESGLLDEKEIETLASQFQALMEIQPSIHALTMVDSSGHDIRLTRNGEQWVLTERREEVLITSDWQQRQRLNSTEKVDQSYSSQNTNWYRGAITTANQPGFFQSSPYPLTTKDAQGVTLSKQWTAYDEPETSVVTALTFTISDLITFMAQFETSLNDRTLLLKKDGTLLSKFQPGGQETPVKTASPPALISAELLKMVQAELAKSISDDEIATSFRYKGKTYWLGMSPLQKVQDDIWLAVLVPEDVLFNDLQQQWKRFGLIVGSILCAAILMSFSLVRRYSYQLKELPQQHVDMYSYEKEVDKLIQAGESTSLEFKSTMRTNLKSGKPGKEIELAWLKTVVAFMNSDGGILLIGVADDGEILGLDADNFENEDKCRLHCKNLLNTHIGAEFTRFITVKLLSIREKTVFVLECERVRQPVFLRVGKNEDFLIRSGPSSTKLTMSQMVKYLNER